MQLLLTRHAKSDWQDPTLADHDRPLNARGKAAAKSLGDWLLSRGYVPDMVICSAALRTRQTWEQMAPAVSHGAEVRLSETLYHASPDRMLQILHEAHGDRVLMIGHNPGIAELARLLPSNPPTDPDFDHYPTGATAVLDMPLNKWTEAGFGLGQFREFVTPRQL